MAYDMRDFPGARAAFTNAIAAGYTENGVEALLADAYINDNQVAEGLRILQQATAKQGAAAPEDWLRRGVVTAYKARSADYAVSFSSQLVNNYPSTENWALAVSVVRDLGKFQQQEQIDLLRLMERTKSYSEARDYIEYVQSADPRRLPGEALKIINSGIASGKLDPKVPFVTDAKTMATARIPADKASLVGLERDARAANSTAATAMAAGDAYLSYDEGREGRRNVPDRPRQAGRRHCAHPDPPRHRPGRHGPLCRSPGDFRQGRWRAQADRRAVVGLCRQQGQGRRCSGSGAVSLDHRDHREGRRAIAALFRWPWVR
jgi:hypothetical protein